MNKKKKVLAIVLIAALLAGLVQMAVLFPLEKFVLFRKKEGR